MSVCPPSNQNLSPPRNPGCRIFPRRTIRTFQGHSRSAAVAVVVMAVVALAAARE